MPAWSEFVRILRLDVLTGLLLAVFLGAAIGIERELKGKAAGLRTNILICMGATLFTQLSMALSAGIQDKGRIAAQIVTGVGFLGAGTILHGKGSITGLTSAATIWLVAAIGTAIGADEFYLAAGATLITLLVLRALGWVEAYVKRSSEVSRLTVEVEPDPRRVDEVEQLVRQAGADVEELHSEVQGNKIVVGVTLRGSKRAQDQAKLSLLRASGAYTLSVEE